MDINIWGYWNMTVKEKEMKRKLRNEYFMRAKLILMSKFNWRNKNTLAVSVMSYGAEILSGIRMSSMKLTERPGNLWQWVMYRKSEVAQLYVSRKIGERGLAGC